MEPTSPALTGRFFTTEPPGKPDPAFTQPASRRALRSSPLGHGQVLAQPQLLEATKNKVVCLDNHRDLETTRSKDGVEE